MADAGIKKAVFNKSTIPAVSGEAGGIFLKYRILSEDGSLTSTWSNLYFLPVPSVVELENSLVLSTTNNTVSLVWSLPPSEVLYLNTFDIYVKWGTDPWEYLTNQSNTSYSTLIKSGATSVQFAVQLPTYPKQRYGDYTYFETANISI